MIRIITTSILRFFHGWHKWSHDNICFVPIVTRNKNALVNLDVKEEDTSFLEEKDIPFNTYTNVLNMLSLNGIK